MKFTSHIIVITSNYDCYMLYGKSTEPNKSYLHIIELDSYDGQIIKGYGCERDNEYIEDNTGDLNAAILHFRAAVQSDSEFYPYGIFLTILVFIYRLLMAIKNLILT